MVRAEHPALNTRRLCVSSMVGLAESLQQETCLEHAWGEHVPHPHVHAIACMEPHALQEQGSLSG